MHRYALGVAFASMAVLSVEGCSAPQRADEPPPEPAVDAGAAPEAAEAEADAAATDAEAAVRRFWAAATAGDMVALEAAVGFPMSLDGMCRVVGSVEELRSVLGGDTGADEGIVLVTVRHLLPDSEMPPSLRRAIAGLAAQDGNCGEPTDELVRRAASFERRYYGVTFAVAGERVERATRVSRIEGRWLVTGIDN